MRLWLFNLDAELELERAGRPYQTPRQVAQALAPMLEQAQRLMAPGDASLAPLPTPGPTAPVPSPASGARWLGCAWCPTPSAQQRLARAGAELAPSPSLEVLRRVNHRRFYVDLGGGAPGARYVADEADLAATLAEASAGWLFKRPFGFAGRGQRRILGTPSKDDRRWLDDSLRQGGFVAEPWLELVRELGVHGWLDGAGRLTLGRICVQETNAHRAWVGTRLARPDDLSSAQAARLSERAEQVGRALFAAGYFGPFGLDAYLFDSGSGPLTLNPLGELNARYGMGFPIGFPAHP